MDLNQYEQRAARTATYSGTSQDRLSYYGIALGGEVGEVLNEIKKHLRSGFPELTPERRDAVILEMGDTLWYFAALAKELGVPMGEIARRNIEKLEARYQMKGVA